MNRTALLLALLLALPSAGATFADPLPTRSDAVTAIASDGTHVVVGHIGGAILGLDPATLGNLWSAAPGGGTDAVHALALAGGLVAAAEGPRVTALRADNGSKVWETTLPATVGDLAGPTGTGAGADGSGGGDGTFLAALDDGDVVALDAQGTATVVASPGGHLTGLARRGADWAAAGDQGLVVAVQGATLRDGGATSLVAWTGAGRGLALRADGLHPFHVDGGQLVVGDARAFLAAPPTALLGRDGGAVLGDLGGLVHPLDADGAPTQPPLATYANAVLDLAWAGPASAGDQVVAAFRGGWVGQLALTTAPVGLILEPAAQQTVGSPLTVRWAYADPDAKAGDQVRHRLLVRPAGAGASAWQVVASGFSPVDPLTRLRSQRVDLSAFGSGVHLDVRLELVDATGLLRADQLSQPILVDSEPPVESGHAVPAEGDLVRVKRPTFGIGHHDSASGVDASQTQVLVDGGAVPLDVQAYAGFTEAKPTADLADGPHIWSAAVHDRAGNVLERAFHFVVDTTAPVPSGLAVAAFVNGAAATFTTDEPALCTLTVDGLTASEAQRGVTHRIDLDGLQPGTSYTARVACRDAADTVGQAEAPFATRAPKAGTPAPLLQLTLDPAAPDGSGGYYTAPPQLAASTENAVDLQLSLDGAAPEPWTPPATLPHGNHTALVEALGADGQVAIRTVRVAVDATPPVAPAAVFLPGRQAVTWSGAGDPDSGIAAYHVELFAHGAWSRVATVAAATHDALVLSPDATQARVVAANGAGLEQASAAVDLPHDADRLFSTASLTTTPLAPAGRIEVRALFVPPDGAAQVVLVDKDGVQSTFSDSVLLGPRLRSYTATAGAFQPGVYTVRVRFDTGTEVTAGTLTLLPGTVSGALPTSGTGVGHAERGAPAAAAALTLLAVLACARLRRRAR